MIRARDRIYGTDFRRRVVGLGIHEVPIDSRAPWQNADLLQASLEDLRKATLERASGS